MTDLFLQAIVLFLAVWAALEAHAICRRARRANQPARPPLPQVASPCPPTPATSLPSYDTAPAGSHKRLEQLARDLLDPDMFGYAVSQEVRNAARVALGRPTPRSPKT